jgi:metal-responsive CopG/Arc/MetJ family transcriptional regulator
MKFHIGLTIDKDLLRRIEELRGMTKRSTFMEHLLNLGLKAYLEQQKQKKAEP